MKLLDLCAPLKPLSKIVVYERGDLRLEIPVAQAVVNETGLVLEGAAAFKAEMTVLHVGSAEDMTRKFSDLVGIPYPPGSLKIGKAVQQSDGSWTVPFEYREEGWGDDPSRVQT